MTLKERIEAGLARLVTAINAVDARVTAVSAGSLTFRVAEINLGSFARRSGKFTIAGVGLTIGKPVTIFQAIGPYTGKGTLADEVEMDQILATGSVTSATVITCYWTTQYRVAGNIKFNYLIGA